MTKTSSRTRRAIDRGALVCEGTVADTTHIRRCGKTWDGEIMGASSTGKIKCKFICDSWQNILNDWVAPGPVHCWSVDSEMLFLCTLKRHSCKIANPLFYNQGVSELDNTFSVREADTGWCLVTDIALLSDLCLRPQRDPCCQLVNQTAESKQAAAALHAHPVILITKEKKYWQNPLSFEGSIIGSRKSINIRPI